MKEIQCTACEGTGNEAHCQVCGGCGLMLVPDDATPTLDELPQSEVD